MLVLMRSPMYFWRNLLLLSSLSCSSLTASIRLKSRRRDSCSARACLAGSVSTHSTTRDGGGIAYLCSSSRASRPILSRSSLFLRGLMARTSSASRCMGTGPTSDDPCGTMRVPLLLRLGSRGRVGTGAWISWLSTDDPEEESALSGRGGVAVASASSLILRPGVGRQGGEGRPASFLCISRLACCCVGAAVCWGADTE